MEKDQNANINDEQNQTLENEVQNQQEEISEVNPAKDYEAEISALKDQLLRSAAESDNIRKRYEKQIDDAAKYAVSSFVKDLTNAIENLYRISENIDQNEISSNNSLKIVADGVSMTIREVTGVFERNGVKRINPIVGEEFDHNIHQAVSYIESAEHKAGSIVQVLQSGYLLKDRLLNPAIVAVVKE